MTSVQSPLHPPSFGTDSPRTGSKPGTPRSVTFDLPGRPSPTTDFFDNSQVTEPRATAVTEVVAPSPDVQQEMHDILESVKASEGVYLTEIRELQTYVNLYGNAHGVLESIKEVHRMIPDRIELLEDWVGKDFEPTFDAELTSV
jgi:hypothetical protein